MSRPWDTIRCLPPWFVVPCFIAGGASAWLGYQMALTRSQGASGPARGPKGQIALIFIAYDTQGQAIQARLLGLDPDQARLLGPEAKVTPQPTGDACRLSQPLGKTLELRFKPEFGPDRTESVTWRPTEEFLQWLKSDLPVKLQELDPNYNLEEWGRLLERLEDRASPSAYDYPVLFPARR